MRKRILLFIVLPFILSSAFSASEKRNLSTPLSRLFGHWIDDNSGYQFYFTKVTDNVKPGTLTIVAPDKATLVKYFKKESAKREGKEREFTQNDLENIEAMAGKAQYISYYLISQEPNGKKVIISSAEDAKDMDHARGYECIIEKNGGKMQFLYFTKYPPPPVQPSDVIYRLKYVDSKTSPEG